MKDLKYVKNISPEGEANIYLYDSIGCYVDNEGCLCDGISGSQVALEIEYLQNIASVINIRINSCGGSVVEGYSIVSAILNSKIPVNTYVDGVAFSMAGVIAMCGKEKYIADYGLIMLHNPSNSNDQKLLDLIKGTLVTILATNTPLSENKISEVMDNETFYTADEAKSLGLVNTIVTSNRKEEIKYDVTNSLHEIALVYNKLIKPKEDMIKIKNQLGLEDTAVEETVVDSITELQNEIKKLTENLEAEKLAKDELQSKLNAVENEKSEAKKIEIEEMVNSYVTAGKIKADEKASMIELATVNFESVKNMLDKIGSKNSPDILKAAGITNTANKNDKSSWSMQDWMEKDPSGLAQMKNETRELYDELYKSSYKK